MTLEERARLLVSTIVMKDAERKLAAERDRIETMVRLFCDALRAAVEEERKMHVQIEGELSARWQAAVGMHLEDAERLAALENQPTR